jgi:hypothetical protein
LEPADIELPGAASERQMLVLGTGFGAAKGKFDAGAPLSGDDGKGDA